MTGCEQYEEKIYALLDGDLAPEEEAALREHMARCPDCARLYEAASAAAEILREEQAEPPAALAEGVMARVAAYEAQKKKTQPAGRVKTLRRWLPMAAAACLAVVIAGAVLPGLLAGKRTGGAAADSAAPEAAQAQYAGDENEAESVVRQADVPETVSLTSDMDAVTEEAEEDGAAPAPAAGDSASAADSADAGAAMPMPAPIEEPTAALGYTVYDAGGVAVGAVTDTAGLSALLEGGTAASGGPADYEPLYTLTVDGVGYVLAGDGEDGLVWWTDEGGPVTRSPGALSEFLALIG